MGLTHPDCRSPSVLAGYVTSRHHPDSASCGRLSKDFGLLPRLDLGLELDGGGRESNMQFNTCMVRELGGARVPASGTSNSHISN